MNEFKTGDNVVFYTKDGMRVGNIKDIFKNVNGDHKYILIYEIHVHVESTKLSYKEIFYRGGNELEPAGNLIDTITATKEFAKKLDDGYFDNLTEDEQKRKSDEKRGRFSFKYECPKKSSSVLSHDEIDALIYALYNYSAMKKERENKDGN